MEDGLYEKVKSYVFPAKKVLDKAGTMGKPPETKLPPDDSTGELQKIVNARMAEKLAPKKSPMTTVCEKPPCKK